MKGLKHEVTKTLDEWVYPTAFSLMEEVVDTTPDLEEVVFGSLLEGKKSSLVNNTEILSIKIF